MEYKLDKEEFNTIHNSLLKMVEMMCDVAKVSITLTHEIKLKRLELDTRRQDFEEAKHGFLGAQTEPFPTLEDEESISEEDPLPFPQPAPEVAEDRQFDGTDNVVELDYVAFDKFMDSWLVNFNEEGPQPDRQKLLNDLIVMKGPAYLAQIFEKSGGITRAFFAYFRRNDPGYANVEHPFFVASNFVSVVSLLYPPYCKHFKYVNPLSTEDI